MSEDGDIFIGRVLHKSYIFLDEKGTKAGAATVAEMDAGATAPPEEPKTVYLDHPFIYRLITFPSSSGLFWDYNKLEPLHKENV